MNSFGSKRWQHRTVGPEVTLQRLEHVQDAVGITRVADLTELDRIGIPVCQAVRPLGRLLTTSQGKGVTKTAAKVSAMMEATEIWHAENQTLTGPRAKISDIKPEAHLDPFLFRNRAYEGQMYDVPIPWTRASDLTSADTKLVPRDCADLDFTRLADPPWLMRNTNGLAGGNTFGEAIASALAEVIERYCRAEFMLLDDRYRSMRRLDPDLLVQESDALANLILAIKEAGLELDLFDLTNKLHVTTIKAVVYETNKVHPVHRPSQGHGAHLDPTVAVSRAITEAAQARLTFISGNRDDLNPIHYQPWNDFNAILAIERKMDFSIAQKQLDLTDQSSASPEGDVDLMVEKISSVEAGPVLSIDLTNSTFGIPVTKVVAPHLVLNSHARRRRR